MVTESKSKTNLGSWMQPSVDDDGNPLKKAPAKPPKKEESKGGSGGLAGAFFRGLPSASTLGCIQLPKFILLFDSVAIIYPLCANKSILASNRLKPSSKCSRILSRSALTSARVM